MSSAPLIGGGPYRTPCRIQTCLHRSTRRSVRLSLPLPLPLSLTSPPHDVDTDEVNAVVLDIGTYQAKAGYAGEDAPKFSCPSQLGVSSDAAPVTTSRKAKKEAADAMDIDDRVFKTGQPALETPTEHMEVVSPFQDGIFEDWDAVAVRSWMMMTLVGWLSGGLTR